MANTRRRLEPLYVAIAGIGLALNVWFRGPFFGVVMLLFTLPVPLLLVWGMRRLRVKQVAVWGVGIAATAGISYLFLGPLTASQVFSRILRCPPPREMREVVYQDLRWGIDPAYYLRFRTDAESI